MGSCHQADAPGTDRTPGPLGLHFRALLTPLPGACERSATNSPDSQMGRRMPGGPQLPNAGRGPRYPWALVSTPGSLSLAPLPPGRARSGPASRQRASPLAERSLSLTEDQVSAFGAGHQPQPKAMGNSRFFFTCPDNHRSPACPPPPEGAAGHPDHPSPMDLRGDIKTSRHGSLFPFLFIFFINEMIQNHHHSVNAQAPKVTPSSAQSSVSPRSVLGGWGWAGSRKSGHWAERGEEGLTHLF